MPSPMSARRKGVDLVLLLLDDAEVVVSSYSKDDVGIVECGRNN